ncbi:MAG: two-component sensor histidine kinase [Melioribacter sp.]|nr:two-component sensor histidine kinase [Melioribacter sp.]
MSNLKKYFFFSKRIILVIYSVTTFLIILFSYFFNLTIIQLLGTILFFAILDSVLIFIISKSRKDELLTIKNVIERIRTNSFNSADEIKLGNDLKELEEEIKSMFLRTQNDITNLKRLEQVRTEFLGNVSHELRTPIFAIQGYIETLLDGAINDENVNKSFLQKAIQHTNNLNNLLNDLINISMIESGQMLMSFRYFNVHEFLEGIVHELKPVAEKKNLELNLVEFNPTLQLFGDKQRLKQVMTNLIQNALKYTETGKVDVGVVEEGSNGRIFVRDTGIGISPNEINRIFERFYRVDKDRSREMGGTGLGLAIVKHIVDAHGSKVELVSHLGKGSEFSFGLKK